MAQFDDLLRSINDLNRRLRTLEVVNQTGILQFGDITINSNTSRITLGTGANAIILDGTSSKIVLGGLSLVLDGLNKRIIASDGSNNRVLIDGNNGKIKVSRLGWNVLTASNTNLILSSDFSFVKETWLQMIPQWQNSWTTNTFYSDVDGALNSINFTDWPDHAWYWEHICKTDANTGSYQLYNVTTSAAVSGSELTTTSTVPVRLRTGSLTKPSGTNSIKVQHKISSTNGSQYANSIMSRSVFRID